jgi:hypothetical protein
LEAVEMSVMLVAGAGFEAVDGAVEFLRLFRPVLIASLKPKNPRQSNAASLPVSTYDPVNVALIRGVAPGRPT